MGGTDIKYTKDMPFTSHEWMYTYARNLSHWVHIKVSHIYMQKKKEKQTVGLIQY